MLKKIYYEDLYTEKTNFETMDTNLTYFTNAGTIPKILDTDREMCDSEILESEILCSLKELKSSHSPGTDGLTSDFYQFFWIDIKILLVDSIKYSEK